MGPDGFRRIAMALANVVEGAHMGHPDFRVNGRIFATLRADGRFGMVKLAPDQQQAFVDAHPGVFAPESGAWGRAGSTRVDLEAAGDEEVGEALTLARRLAAGARDAKPPRSR
jgi:hypothetical protein